MSKKKKIILSTLLSILSIAILYGILFYFSFFQGFVTVKDNKVQSKLLPNDDFTSSYTPKLNFKNTKEELVSDVKVNMLNNIDSSIPVIKKSQRHYIPLDYVCKTLGYNLTKSNNAFTISNSNYTITLSEDSYTKGNKSLSLRGNILTNNNQAFISISDIEEIFNLISVYTFENQTINILKNPQSNIQNNSYETSSDGKIALVRLEDFTAGEGISSETNQPKFKAMANFLSNSGIKYHIAWIPRFKAPNDNIDNDLLTVDSFENAAFINLLDYFINHGALIGLHGYTHQAGDSRSAVGTELSRKVNSSEEETRAVIENAINTATALNIPFGFFESSHYKASSAQKSIIEEYFQYIYEPKNYLIYTKLQKTKNNNLYIPTPLSYVRDLDANPIIKKLNKPTPGLLASFFYHSTKELDFIEVDTSNNVFDVKYSIESPLQQIVKSLNENKYITTHVTELKN